MDTTTTDHAQPAPMLKLCSACLDWTHQDRVSRRGLCEQCEWRLLRGVLVPDPPRLRLIRGGAPVA